MPIVFIFSGILFICILLNVFNISNKLFGFGLSLLCGAMCVSYFCEEVNICDVYFNFIQVLILCVLLIFFAVHSKCNFLSIFISILTTIFYYYLFEFDIECFDNFDDVMIIFSLFFSLIFKNYSCGFFCNILSCVGMSIVNICKQLDMYTFAIVNVDIVFLCMLIYSYVFCLRCILFNELIMRGKNNYGYFKKKMFFDNYSAYYVCF